MFYIVGVLAKSDTSTLLLVTLPSYIVLL